MRLFAPSLLFLLLAACGSDKGNDGEGGTIDGNADGTDGGDGGQGTSFSVNPSSLDFGALFVGQSAEQVLSIENTGDATLGLELALTSEQSSAYNLSLANPSPGAGESTDLVVLLIPSTWGNHDATLSLTDAASGDLVTVLVTASVETDKDGDGQGSAESGGEDCDDNDATVYTGADEVWYDGVDSDCAGDNDYDQDGDGTTVDTDCDDTDATAYPGAEEIWYDGVDQDCLDGDDYDQDADGYTVDADCDDTQSTAYPGAEEIWYDGVDQACDGGDDYDQDGDGSKVDVDCDDLDATAYPGADEIWYDGIDEACDGGDDDDQDGDGVTVGTDCDDLDATIYPGAPDPWYDGTDSDCAGNNDNDQDADGYEVSVDCLDTDGTVNPGATEVWYDGVDQNCDGANDNDQDGDSYEVSVDCLDTDSTVYPGASDAWYDGIDSDCAGDNDYDQDGDGTDYPTDCNDEDATVTGPTAEVWDGIDNDCSGYIDDFDIADIQAGVVYGGTASMAIGDPLTLSLGGDETGDGTDDLAIGTTKSSYGYVYIVAGDDMLGADGVVGDYDSATIAGYSSSYSYPIGNLIGPMQDIDQDGTADLLTVGTISSYYYSYSGYGWLLYGDTSSGSVSALYDAYFVGDSSGDSTRVMVSGDIDGDGFGDIVVGHPGDNSGSGGSSRTGSGNVCVFWDKSGDFSDGYDISDAEDEFNGAASYDYLGYNLAVDDWNNDGYADILMGAPGVDTGATTGGGVYLTLGNSALSWSSSGVEDSDTLRVVSVTASSALGSDPLAQGGDLDGNGTPDLVLSSETLGAAWLWYDSTMSGSVSTSSTSATFSGTAGDFGSSVVYDVDFDGDGNNDILIGDDGNDHIATNAGALWFFTDSSLWSGAVTAVNQSGVIWGTAASDGLGSGLASGGDVNGDGKGDVLVGASGVDTGASEGGAAYLLLGM